MTSTGTTADDKAAHFNRYLKVGFTITMDSITRTVTKVVSPTLIHVDRAFKEGVQYNGYSYRYSVRKTGDYHMHWKPQTRHGAPISTPIRPILTPFQPHLNPT